MLNVIALMGRLTAEPELRKTPSGTSTCTITIACERNFARQGEERETDFFDIVCWRQTAEFVCKYFRKGQMIAVNGRLQTRSYETRDGSKRKVVEVIADNVCFTGDKGGGQASQGGQSYDGFAPAPRDESGLTVNAYTSGGPNDFAVIDDSEDLPF